MHFIGIISGKDFNKIARELYKILDEKDFNIIEITNEAIENIKNVKFDAILITNASLIPMDKKESLKKVISNTKYLVINTDTGNDLKILEEANINVITYGFNSKNTITASSIKQDNILVCIQRNIININGKTIEQQDKKIDIVEKCNVDYMLGIVAILIIFEKI